MKETTTIGRLKMRRAKSLVASTTFSSSAWGGIRYWAEPGNGDRCDSKKSDPQDPLKVAAIPQR